MDRIMSTSIILSDQNSSANDVDIMVFEPSVLFPPPQFGGIDDMVQILIHFTEKTKKFWRNKKSSDRPNWENVQRWLPFYDFQNNDAIEM